MKRSIIAAAVLSSVFMSAGAFAADSDQGELIIKGLVEGTSCVFVDNNTATITMNQVGLDRLQSLGVGGIYTGYTHKTTKPLTVKCTTGKPNVYFSSSQFNGGSNKNITINTASENGVGFVVYQGDKLDTPIDPAKPVELTGGTDGVYTLDFSARYAKTSQTVTAGEVASTLTLTIVSE